MTWMTRTHPVAARAGPGQYPGKTRPGDSDASERAGAAPGRRHAATKCMRPIGQCIMPLNYAAESVISLIRRWHAAPKCVWSIGPPENTLGDAIRVRRRYPRQTSTGGAAACASGAGVVRGNEAACMRMIIIICHFSVSAVKTKR